MIDNKRLRHIIILLSLNGLGRKTAFKIMDFYNKQMIDSDKELFDLLRRCKSEKLVSRLKDYEYVAFEESVKKAENIINKSEESQIGLVSYFDEEYPNSLKEINDPPLILNYKGDIELLNKMIGVAIIGTRKPSSEGFKSGEYFGKVFSKAGFNIVSGLALGCDSSAHLGSLKANGVTTAILAHGLDKVYPKENLDLSKEIVNKGGLLLSEYFVGTNALPNYFVERDRLQSGLAKATIVIQTAIKGGTMHAVKATLNADKILAAVEYKNEINNDKVEGNKMLIKEKNAFALKSDNYKSLIGLISSNHVSDNLKNDSNQQLGLDFEN